MIKIHNLTLLYSIAWSLLIGNWPVKKRVCSTFYPLMFCCIKGLFPAISESRSAIPLDPNGFAVKSFDRISISSNSKYATASHKSYQLVCNISFSMRLICWHNHSSLLLPAPLSLSATLLFYDSFSVMYRYDS